MFQLRTLSLAAVAILCFSIASAALQRTVPNASLEFTIQQKDAQRTEKGFHFLRLFCWDGECSLTILTLNQCGPSSSGTLGFYPGIARTSTREGNLEVTTQGNVLVTKETGRDIGGDYVTTLRIGFERPPQGTTATLVTSFSGGFVKNSNLLKKVITVEYVPLLQGHGLQPVRLDCDMLLPGVGK